MTTSEKDVFNPENERLNADSSPVIEALSLHLRKYPLHFNPNAGLSSSTITNDVTSEAASSNANTTTTKEINDGN